MGKAVLGRLWVSYVGDGELCGRGFVREIVAKTVLGRLWGRELCWGRSCVGGGCVTESVGEGSVRKAEFRGVNSFGGVRR